MTINIQSDISKIFKQYLTIFNSILDTRKLTKMEIEVLSKMLHINYQYKHLSKKDRDIIIFHKETKDRIRQSINLSKHSYNNILTSLRKKQLISNRELLINTPLVNNQIQLNFNLILNGNNTESGTTKL